MEVAEQLLTIDLRLRFALFGLECALGVTFSGVECERVFRDAAADQVSAKKYVFHESSNLVVTGRVEEYEPDSVWLRVGGRTGVREILRRVVEGAEHQAIRIRRTEDQT